jgi:hypothetical protein
MVLGIVATARNAMLDALNARINLGAGAGLLRIYDGSRPATGGAATTLLAELTLSDPAAPAAAAGVLTLSAITQDSSANATGTATWFRIVDSDANAVFDGSVTATGGGGDLQLVTTSITATQPVQVSSFTITAGNA